MRRATSLATGLAALAVIVWSTPAWAPYHLSVIDQVFFGTADCPNAQYVMLRTLAPGQVLVGTTNQDIRTQNADGSAAAGFGQFIDDPSDGDLGVAILMGTADAATLFGLTLDQVVDGRLIFADGRVCFGTFLNQPVDCVAYGSFTGDNGNFGGAAPRPELGMALARQGSTGNNASDFVLAAPAPRNNAGQTGVLGTCGGAAPTATPTVTVAAATPTITAPPVATCEGDCNDNGVVAVNELITAVNIVLGSAAPSGCPAFPQLIEISNLVRAVNNLLNGCPATPTPTNTVAASTPTSTVDQSTPTATRTPGGPLGVRHFSINPQTSDFIAVIGPGVSFPSPGFQGFLELTAGIPQGPNGVAFVDLTGASEYLSVNIAAAGIALCLRIPPDQLPVVQAGVVSCNGGLPLGLELTQDHDIGVVGACAGGTNDGLACSADAQCPEATCFSAEACAAAHGHVEAPGAAHPGVCNGPLSGSVASGDSGPGAVLISPDPINGLTKGLPVEITMEHALPCGDEDAPGMSTMIALTTGHARCRVLHYNDSPTAELVDERDGENFSCAGWEEENGPGTFVLSAPQLDLPAVGPQPTDLIFSFVLDD